MTNPNAHFYAMMELVSVAGFTVSMIPPIKFLQNDSLVMSAYFRRKTGEALPTSGFTVKMTIGGNEIDGTPIDYNAGKWQFVITNTVTSLLTAQLQDATFVLTRTSSGDQTFIRVADAVQPVSIS